MSPEYALDGLFSEKSDVFSFGVMVLEIISGKRNTGFYQSEKKLSLLGQVRTLNHSPFSHSLAYTIPYSTFYYQFVSGMEAIERRQGVGADGSDTK